MWSFLNPLFLTALAAALIPLVLHLWQRRRTVVVPFSAVRFLKLAQKRSSNRVRLENIILWILRTLILLLLALAFALPIMRVTSFRRLVGTSRRDIAIVWDVSYSMGYISGQNKVWSAARDTGLALIDTLRPGDRACLFLADEDVTPLIEQPTTDLEMIRSRIRALEPGTSSSQLRPAILAAISALQESLRREKELFIITDGQELPWASFNPDAVSNAGAENHDKTNGQNATNPAVAGNMAGAGISFFAALLGVSAPENAAPLDLDIEPALLMQGVPGRLSTTIGRTGTEENLTVALSIDNQAVSQRAVTLGGGSKAELVFALPALKPGSYPARIETSPDGVELDNTFYFLLQVHEKIPALCIGTEPDAFFLLRALNPGATASTINVSRVDPESFTGGPLSEFTCIFLCNALPLAGQAMIALEQYVQQGGVIVIFPGDRAGLADYANWSCLPGIPAGIADFGTAPRRQALRLGRRGDPLFAGMQVPPGTYPSAAINRALQWDKLATDSDAVIFIDNDAPFLLRRKAGRGLVFVFSVSADRLWSNLPLSPFFLPLAHQIVRYSAGLKQNKPFFWTGRNLALSDIMGAPTPGTELLDPAGRSVHLRALKTGQSEGIGMENCNLPGIYTLKPGADGAPRPLLAVNARRAESDLKRVDPASLARLTGITALKVAEDKEGLLQLVRELRIGRPLAEPLLWLVFLLGIAELFLANKSARRARTLTDQLKIDMTGRVKGEAAG